MTRRRLFRGTLGLAAGSSLAALLAACRADDRVDTDGRGQSQPTTTTVAAGIRRGGTLLVALNSDPNSLDPLVSRTGIEVAGNIMEPLVRLDAQLQVVPWLAGRYEQPDAATYLFHLRDGVAFQDGTAFDAAAVRFSLDRVRAYKAGPGYTDAQAIADVATPDARLARISTRGPDGLFLTLLTEPMGWIVSPAAVAKEGEEGFGRRPVGTGPFRFRAWKADDHLRLERFDRHWNTGSDGAPLPYLDAIEWRIISEPTARVAAVQAGDAHLAYLLRDQDLPLVRNDPALMLVQQPGFGYGGLFLTINRPPFDNKALRQAMAHAVDREELVRVAWEGNAAVSHGPIPPRIGWASEQGYAPYPTDPQKARQRLAEGGKPEGFTFECWNNLLHGSAGMLALELIQTHLARVGMKMQIQQGDLYGALFDRLKGGEFDAYYSGGGGHADPARILAPFRTGAFGNTFPYSNGRIDTLLDRGRASTNREERGAIYREAHRILAEDLPVVFLWERIFANGFSKRVQGWYVGYKATSGYGEYWLSG